MTVGGVAAASPAQRAARRGAAGGFAVPAESAADVGAAAATEASSAVMLGGMLALQEEDSAEIRDRRARRHGHAMLEELARLQRALLGGPEQGAEEGGDQGGALRRLEGLTRMVPDAADPALRGLIQSVALRAQIELARRAAPLDDGA